MSAPVDPTAAPVLRIPDLGGAEGVTVLEVLVKPGDRVDARDAAGHARERQGHHGRARDGRGRDRASPARAGDKVTAGTAIATLAGSRAATPSSASEETITHASLRATEPYGGEPYLDTVPIKPLAPAAGRVQPRPLPRPCRVARRRPAAAARRRFAAGRHAHDFDLVVLGAGPGGYTAAFRAADLGLSVALIERGPTLGGVCLNVGCIPSKALLHAARVIEDARAMAEHGIRFGEPEIDAAKLREWKDSVVARLTERPRRARAPAQGDGDPRRGEVRFAHELEVAADGAARRVSFAQCIIAVGSEPVRLPGLPDDPRIIDSTGALELDLPDSLLVIGGGIIGLEMATVYDALGVRVSVVGADSRADAGLRSRPGAAAREAHRAPLRAHPGRHARDVASRRRRRACA